MAQKRFEKNILRRVFSAEQMAELEKQYQAGKKSGSGKKWTPTAEDWQRYDNPELTLQDWIHHWDKTKETVLVKLGKMHLLKNNKQ